MKRRDVRAKELVDALKASRDKARSERDTFIIRDILPMFVIFVSFLIFLVLIAYITR